MSPIRFGPARIGQILTIALLFGGTALAANDFPTVVRAILESQTDGPLSQMPPRTRSSVIDCVVATLDGLPSGRKRFIVEGGDFEEQEDRFGQVVDDNHAEWRQKLAAACAETALNTGQGFNGGGGFPGDE
jgi:hypothetical protein